MIINKSALFCLKKKKGGFSFMFITLTTTTFVAYLTLASLLLTIPQVRELKVENKKLKEEIEKIKKQMSDSK